MGEATCLCCGVAEGLDPVTVWMGCPVCAACQAMAEEDERREAELIEKGGDGEFMG